MPDIDAALATALKQAKAKEMHFCFVSKGTGGKLLVSKKKITPKEIAEAKKELGGGKPIKGTCTGSLGEMVFTTAKEVGGAVVNALKKVAKTDAGLMIKPTFQVGGQADEDEGEEDAAATPEVAAAPPAAEEEEQEAQEEDQGAPEIPGGDAAKQAEQELDLKVWQAARDVAIKELRELAKKVAGTGHASAAGVLKEVNEIIVKLKPSPKLEDIPKLKDYITNSDVITAAEEAPAHFHAVSLRQPLLTALESLQT